MEYQTTQGGETKLVFDGEEDIAIARAARQLGVSADRVTESLLRLRQADPLASFADLMTRLSGTLATTWPTPDSGPGPKGLAPARPQADPLADLEATIRRRLAAQSGAVNATSQAQHTEAVLLQALAICLQTRMQTRMLADMMRSV